jgi:hypothetical protein
MKPNYTVPITVFLLIICSFANGSYDRKKISNKLYSFSVPSDWESCASESSDGSVPKEREATNPATNVGFHLYYLAWSSPRDKDNFFNTTGLYIQSYQRKDDVPLRMDEIEEEVIAGLKIADVTIIERKDLSKNAHQKRFMLTQMETELEGGITRKVKRRSVYLLHENGNIVHCLQISLRESQYLLPESQVIVQDILDSFAVNSL